MRTTKKALCILLTALLIATSLSAGFNAFAAVSEDQYQALADALDNDVVRNAVFSGSAGTKTVQDADGSVRTAVNAWVAVYNGLINTISASAKGTTANWKPSNFDTNRTAGQINSTITNEMQTRLGDAFDTEVAAFLNNLLCGVTVSTSTSSNSSESSAKNNLSKPSTIKLTVKTPESVILSYETIDDLPESIITSTVYTISHATQTYKTEVSSGTGCNSSTTTTYYAYNQAQAVTFVNGATFRKQQFVDLYDQIAAYADYFGKDLDALVETESATLASVRSAVASAKGDIVDAFNEDIYDHFYGEFDVDTLVDSIDLAAEIKSFSALKDEIVTLCGTDYSEYTPDELQSLYTTISTKVNSYNGASAAAKDYIAEKGYDSAATDAYLADLLNAKELAQLKALKPAVLAAVEEYSEYNDAMIAADELTGAMLVTAYGKINGYKNALATYKPSNVDIVFGEGFTDELTALLAALNDLIAAADARSDISGYYATFIATVYGNESFDADSDDLLAAVSNIDAWYTQLTAEITAAKDELGEERANAIISDLTDMMTTFVDACYAVLFTRLEAEVDTATQLYADIVEHFGDAAVSMASVENYTTLKKALGKVEKDIYDFLAASSNFTFPEGFADKYAALWDIIFADYEAFVYTAGFDRYARSDIANIIRHPAANEVIRDADYEVTDEKGEALVALLDRLLASDEVKELLGLDLKELLNPSLLDGIYTNDFLNTIVQYVYPLVAQEFAKVWADLPETVDADNPIGSGQLTVKLKIDNFEKALNTLKLYVVPTILAPQISSKYPEVAALLAQATTPTVFHKATDTEEEYMDNPWEDEVLCDEEGKLILDWGIDDAEDKKEAFLDAAQSALFGLEPLFLALISNKTIEGTHENEDKIPSSQPGHGKVGTGSTSIQILFTVSVTIDPITLYLHVGGNPGYNNAIIPILEALGLDPEYIPNGNTFNSCRDILELGLINPIEHLLEQAAAAPVEFIVNALPNLAYGVTAQMIVPLLKMLKADIYYHADAHYNAIAGLASGDIDKALSDGPIRINLGEMIDLEDMGLDISSLDAVLALVSDSLGITFPHIDAGKLATMGELTWRTTKRAATTYQVMDSENVGKAAYIVADKTDVLVSVLRYVLKAMADPEFFNSIINLVNNMNKEEIPEDEIPAEEAEEPAEPDPVVISETLQNILDAIISDPDTAIAAITELVFPQTYSDLPVPVLNWKTAEELYEIPDELPEDVTPEMVEAYIAEIKQANSVQYRTEEWSWTEEKANYVAENLASFIDNVFRIIGYRGKDGSSTFGAFIDETLGELYTAENVDKLADVLDGALNGSEGTLAEVLAIVAPALGIDLGSFAEFEPGEIKTRDDFEAAMCELLDPFAPILRFLLTDKDLELKFTDKEGRFTAVTALGHDGYSYGLIPVLEALGAYDCMTPEEFIADDENIVKNILDPLLGVIDNFTDDPYEGVAKLIPQLVYSLDAGVIQAAVPELLYPVNQLLDVIRPIYDVDLSDLIGFDINFAETDFLNFVFSMLDDKLLESTGLDFDLDYTANGLLSAMFYGDVEVYTSANGSTAYRLVNSYTALADTLTLVLRFVISQVVFSDNAVNFAALAKEQFDLDETAYAALYTTLYTFRYLGDQHVDYLLGIVFYIFYGANTAAEAIVDYSDVWAYDWPVLIEMLKDSDISLYKKAANVMEEVYQTSFLSIWDILHDNGHVDLTADELNESFMFGAKVIKAIIQFFREIIEWIQETFGAIG